MTDTVRPVFLIGSDRSGTSLLGCCLAQHPGLRVLPDGAWIGRMALHLERTVLGRPGSGQPGLLEAAGLDRARLFRTFGEAVHACLGTGGRWIDATPANAFCIHGLARMFPAARFVHVVRDPDGVARSLARVPAPDGGYFTEDAAYESWLRTARTCLLAERALGSTVVHRVDYEDLLAEPDDTLRRVLEFLGEEFRLACVRPLRGLGAMDPVPAPVASSGPRFEAMAFARSMEGDRAPRLAPFAEAARRLEEEFAARSRRGGRTGTGSALDRLREIVIASVPPDATILVVSRGDDRLLQLDGRRGWHFPQAPDGLYAGFHPEDSTAAVRHLEDLRRRGAGFLLFPCTSFWWLEHYREFRLHLERRYRLLAWHEDVCLLFALDRRAAQQGTRLVLGASLTARGTGP